MTYTNVKKEQFEFIGKHEVRHIPTNATFRAYSTARHANIANYGGAGNVLPNGDDYLREDVLRVANQLLAGRSTINED